MSSQSRQRSSKRQKNRPAAHRAGVKLFRPTPAYRRWRLIFWAEGQRQERSFHDETIALAAFDDAVTFVEATTTSTQQTRRTRTGPRLVDDLMAELEDRWGLDGAALRYQQSRRGLYRKWIRPVCGQLTVREWVGDRNYCARVLANARADGRAPATVQNIGSLLATLVNLAHELRWAPASANPLHNVKWTAKAIVRGGALWVPDSARPTTSMLEHLIQALAELGETRGVPWAPLVAAVGGYGGLRFGEQTALSPDQYDPLKHRLWVDRAYAQPMGGPPLLGTTKNGHGRYVLLPGSLRASLHDRAADARRHGPDALLFPGPKGPTRPFTEAEWRRLFIAAARDAGWTMVGDRTTPTGLRRGGHPAVPYRNLRHHAAVWMREVAGFDWADVSEALGHHSVAFTLARYVRPGADAEARNRARLDDL